MKTITMLEFRQNMPSIVKGLKRSGEILVTHRGKPAARINAPEMEKNGGLDLASDPFYRICDLAKELADPNEPPQAPLTNAEIDRLVYGI